MFGHNDQDNQNAGNMNGGMNDQQPVVGGLGTPPGQDPAPMPAPQQDNPAPIQPEPVDQTPQFGPSPVADQLNALDQPVAPPTNDTTNDLIDLKGKALHQLAPLVDHLEQSPEDKFRITMMMIQASDNQALIKDAYEAAQQITDEKAKAQALLDVVNEINYFTQNSPIS